MGCVLNPHALPELGGTDVSLFFTKPIEAEPHSASLLSQRQVSLLSSSVWAELYTVRAHPEGCGRTDAAAQVGPDAALGKGRLHGARDSHLLGKIRLSSGHSLEGTWTEASKPVAPGTRGTAGH